MLTRFGVTDENLKPFLEGITISQAISKKRLFIVDFEILDGITCFEEYIVSKHFKNRLQSIFYIA